MHDRRNDMMHHAIGKSGCEILAVSLADSTAVQGQGFLDWLEKDTHEANTFEKSAV